MESQRVLGEEKKRGDSLALCCRDKTKGSDGNTREMRKPGSEEGWGSHMCDQVLN